MDERRVRREDRVTTDDNLKIDLNPRTSANRYEVLHPRVNCSIRERATSFIG